MDEQRRFDEPSGQPERHEPQLDDTEDAQMAGFEEPSPGQITPEAVEISEEQSLTAGIDRGLLDLKRELEQALFTGRPFAAAMSAEAVVGGVGNIVGVGLGLGETAPVPGVETISAAVTPGEYALNIYVAEPVPVERVKASIVDTARVSALSDDNVPVNIIVTGIIDAQPHRWRLRPAPGGVSVAHFRVTAGTIGCLATGRNAPRSSRLLMLSNNHVIANSNRASFNDCICQPGPADGGRCPADQVAVLERFVPINFTGGTNYVDCATGWCWPDRVRRELVYVSGGALQYFRIGSTPVTASIGMLVGKSGRTTQLTTGRITDISATIRVNYGTAGVALFADQLAIQSINANPFSAGGDSGSSIWTWNANRSPVGLLFAGGGNVTFANKIGRVLTALDIRLYT